MSDPNLWQVMWLGETDPATEPLEVWHPRDAVEVLEVGRTRARTYVIWRPSQSTCPVD